MGVWNHVVAPVSRAVLDRGTPPTMVELCQIHREMAEGFAADQRDDILEARPLSIREKALTAFNTLLGDDPDFFDAEGIFIGNPGVDKLRLLQCIRAFWSDGEQSPVPDISDIEAEMG